MSDPSRSWEDVYRTQTAEIERLRAELAAAQERLRLAEKLVSAYVYVSGVPARVVDLLRDWRAGR